VLFAVLVVCGFLLYRGTQQVPQFYAASVPPELSPPEQEEQARLGDEFEREVLELHNDTGREGQWQAVFSDREVNAWLAVDLVQNHPRALPPDLIDPRVRIGADRLQVACRYQGERLETVVSIEADAYLTDKPNQLAVRICGFRAGVIPLPLKQLMDRVTDAARKGGVQLVWSQQDGDPVALLQVPAEHQQFPGRELCLETLELRDGEIFLAGRTVRASKDRRSDEPEG
jgi:hypothetical protein